MIAEHGRFEALMEYHVAKQLGVANKILGLAHQRFPDEVEFVVRYLAFLMSVNDENSESNTFTCNEVG
jgi:cleavage stimulation factor subunit 3